MSLNGFDEIKTPEAWKKAVIEKLDSAEASAPRKRNIGMGRMFKLLPAAAIIMTMGITVAAIGLSNRDTVENIYFDRDIAHNLIAEFNPQYGAYLTEEGIKQLDDFKPIALDVTDHSGHGNDLKSATLLGVMADKYTMTSIVEVEFNREVVIPEDNVENMSRYCGSGYCFGGRTTEDRNIKYNNVISDDVRKLENAYAYVGRPINPIESEDKQIEDYITSQFFTNILVAPVADKPNTALVFIEDRRTHKQCPIEKNSSVRYTIEDFEYLDYENMKVDRMEATYVFDIPTPKKLISADKIKVNEEFTFRDCKYNIKSIERAQSYVEINYTCELTPDFYERIEHSGNADKNYDYEIVPPDIAIRNADGKLIPTGLNSAFSGEIMPKLYAGKDYPAFNPDTVHTAIIHFEKPQNGESVGKLAFTHTYAKDREIYTVPLD